MVELARRINLSQPATHARVRRLEEHGYIRGYVALVDRELAGFDLLCFIHITMQLNQNTQLQKYTEAIRAMPEVLECHHITGDYSYLVKLRARDPAHLEQIIARRIKPIAGVARTQSVIALSTAKETLALDCRTVSDA
jgi:Lrp/AsnC family leucine-responsive transcriptional regulator